MKGSVVMENGKKAAILLGLLVGTLTMTACDQIAKLDFLKKGKQISYGGEPIAFEHIYWKLDNCSNIFQVIEVTKTKDGVYMEHYEQRYSSDEKEILHMTEGGEELYQEIAALLGDCYVDQWNGFHKSASDVLDGYSFSLELTLEDKSMIQATGSNSYPEYYNEFVTGLKEHMQNEE